MQARFTPVDIAMTCHGMTCGYRAAAGYPPLLVPDSWQYVSTAYKATAIGEIERVLRSERKPRPGLRPDELTEHDLIMLITGRMAAELR